MFSGKKTHYRSSGRWVSSVFYRRIGELNVLLLVLVSVLVLLGLFQASPSFSQSPSVVINEIMYNPPSPWDDNYNEWIEIKNVSSGPVDLSSWTLCGKSVLAGYVSEEKIYKDEGLVLGVGQYALITDGVTSSSTKGTEVYSNFSVSSSALALHPENAASLCGGSLPNESGKEKELVLTNGSYTEPLKYQVSWGGNGDGKSVALKPDGNWDKADPTPGAENSFPKEDQQQEEQQPQPAIVFSAPSAVSVSAPFSVSVTLENFKAGTYSLKVLIGKGDKFYDGRTKGTNGEWLAWNAGWVDFPKVTVSSSGSGSGTVQAKTDDDVVAGSYLIKVRAYDGKNTSDSDTKPLKVTGTVASESNSSTTGSSSESGDGESSFAKATEDTGEVKGEKAPQEEGFKLNFYTILGIFGLLVGSGGLILAFRRKAQRSQTPDTPELRQDLP